MLKNNPIKGAVMTSAWHASADVAKFTPLHPWRSQHQQSTGRMTRETNEFWIHKKLEHRNTQTHPHLLVESAVKLNYWNRPSTKSPPNEPKTKRRKGLKKWKRASVIMKFNFFSLCPKVIPLTQWKTGDSSRNRKGNLTSGIIIIYTHEWQNGLRTVRDSKSDSIDVESKVINSL